MYQTPSSSPDADATDVFNSTYSDSVSAALESIKSCLDFIDFDSAPVLLTCLLLAGSLIVLLVWYLDKFLSWCRWWKFDTRNRESVSRRKLPMLDPQALEPFPTADLGRGHQEALDSVADVEDVNLILNDVALVEAEAKSESEFNSQLQALKARHAESVIQVERLQDKLAVAEERLVESEEQYQARNELDSDQSVSVNHDADQLASQLASVKQELEDSDSKNKESGLALDEAKNELVNARQEIEELQSRVDVQRETLEEVRSENLEHVQKATDHESAMEGLKASQSAMLETSRSDFDAISSALSLQVSELRSELGLVQSESAKLQSVSEQALADSLASLKKEVNLRAEVDSSVEILTKELKTKKADFYKLETKFFKSEKALATKSKGEKSEQDLQAKLNRVEEELVAKNLSFAQVEDSLSRAKESLASHQSKEKVREDELQAKADGFEQELSTKAAAFSKLESDLLKSEEALAAVQTKEGERAHELQADLDRVKGELDTQTATSDQLEADLLKAQESLESSKSNEKDREEELQSKTDDFEKKLSTQAAASAQLEADLLKAEESFASYQAEEQQREAELQAKAEGLEKELSTQSDASAQLEADLLKAEESFASYKADEQQREKELQSKAEGFEQELTAKVAAFTQLESDYSKSEEALAVALANGGEREKELRVDLELLSEELNTQTAKLEADLLQANEAIASVEKKDREREVELASRVDGLEKDLSSQVAAFADLESKLLQAKQALAAAQTQEENREQEFQADLNSLEEKLSTQTSASATLESDLAKAQQSLATHEATQQQREVELQATAEGFEKELSTQTAAFSKLESSLSKSEEALAAASAKYEKREIESQAELKRLEKELKTQVSASAQLETDLAKAQESLSSQEAESQQREKELQSKAVGFEKELSTQATALSKLESDLLESEKALKQATEEQQLQRGPEEELAQLRLQLNTEKAKGVESLEKVASHESMILNLQSELSGAAVNRTNYQTLAKKMVGYKKLYRENELRVEDLTKRTSRMSDLATEYFETAKGLQNEMSSQSDLVDSLKQQLREATRNNGSASKAGANGSANGIAPDELNGLVEKRARGHLLKMKADFEKLIKRKNDQIRKLRKEKEMDWGNQDGQNGSERDTMQVNSPR